MGKVVTFTGESMSPQRVADWLQGEVEGGVDAVMVVVARDKDRGGEVLTAWSTTTAGCKAYMLGCLDSDLRSLLYEKG